MTKGKNLDSFNFAAVILHPNTETLLIEKRNWILKNQLNDYYPLFPLYGVLSQKNFSPALKNEFTSLAKCSLSDFFICNKILYATGKLFTSSTVSNFIIPCAIEKKTDSKELLSVFKLSFDLIQSFNQLQNEFIPISTDDNSSEITFRSFQIGDCFISKNQYSVFENFWVKVK